MPGEWGGGGMARLFSRGRKSRSIMPSVSNMESWGLVISSNESRRQKTAKKEPFMLRKLEQTTPSVCLAFSTKVPSNHTREYE